jgi:hypothetical protein
VRGCVRTLKAISVHLYEPRKIAGEEMSPSCFRVKAMSTPSQGRDVETAPIPDPEWLRAKRGAIHTEADLQEFDEELGRLVDDLADKPGGTVPAALGWTAGAVLVAALVMLGGWGLMEMGSAMWEWLSE